ncbi:unnamed protein product [Tenebrio molitor]|nr:unnamed protein product [Tenebrio molitor]
MYTAAEYAEMLIIYGGCRRNAREDAREYAIRFPRRLPHPNYNVFLRLVYRARDTGSLFTVRVRRLRTRRRRSRVLKLETSTVKRVHGRMSWAYRVGVSPYTVWRTLKEQGLHPYHIQLVQGLKPEDLLKRVRFCEWLLEKNEEPQFIERLLTTDETTFTRDGIFNARNTHLWPNS